MPVFILVVLLLILLIRLFMQQPMFGKLPARERLQRIRRSPQYRNGAFQNSSFTPALTNGETYLGVIIKILFSNTQRLRPISEIPSVKTNLFQLPLNEDVLVWFGHSSYYMQVDGKRILVDPVLSGSASPLPGATKAFKGTDIYTTEDIPVIDYLFITHDHWDHLDYSTIKKLIPKIKNIICPLGVGAHLEYWGYDSNIINEKDWTESVETSDGLKINVVPARHFSGRGFKRNHSLWASYVLQTAGIKIFIGGDSGYDTHFADIGQQFGPFDLAILENGQYDLSWKYIHLLPGEFLQAAQDLRAKKILPVHSGKFRLGNHAWDEPLQKLTANNKHVNLQVITPMIGETVKIKNETQRFSTWWESVK